MDHPFVSAVALFTNGIEWNTEMGNTCLEAEIIAYGARITREDVWAMKVELFY